MLCNAEASVKMPNYSFSSVCSVKNEYSGTLDLFSIELKTHIQLVLYLYSTTIYY